ncbi:ATP-binding protein [Catenulispora pinisilvae]|uniref:ATP-binding protein n=1 Tax=Catenulispora pinisilvae TaxID=2705253 RepID=UPI0018913A35|nr:ATP-binding protein [Catenulispora pinisilvae]
MTAVLDMAAPQLDRAETRGFPDDTTLGIAREARLDRRVANPVADARAFALACAWDWCLPETTRNDIVLVVDELVANAVKHAAWPAGRHVVLLRLGLIGQHVSVEVRDPDPRSPRWPGSQVWDLAVIDGPADPDDEELVRGHGLGIVAALVDDLCALQEPHGKVVRASIFIGGAR